MPPIPLRQALFSYLNHWRNDLPGSWRGVLEGVEPAFDWVREDLFLHDGETIFPGRRGAAVPQAPAFAHVFRALEKLKPSAVKAVVIGQDPYPRISRATGRAFDQGDLTGWSGLGNSVTTSMRRLLQVAAHQRNGDESYLGTGGWNRVAVDIESGVLKFLAPREQFDAWEEQGVLWLNAGLTLSRYAPGGAPEQVFGHLPLWRPVIRQILRHLALRADKQVVFLAWGGFAQKVLADTELADEPVWNVSAGAATHVHPAAMNFLQLPNPLAKANSVLTELGGPEIEW